MRRTDLAISIRQPWAELILLGRKTIEIRSWDTDYAGPLWLHTGKFADPDLDQRFGISHPARGAFVGRIVLEGVSPIDRARWETWRSEHLDPGSYEPGMFAWILSFPERLRVPLPAPGKLKLYEVDEATAAQMRGRLEKG